MRGMKQRATVASQRRLPSAKEKRLYKETAARNTAPDRKVRRSNGDAAYCGTHRNTAGLLGAEATSRADLLEDNELEVLADRYEVSVQALTFRLANLNYS